MNRHKILGDHFVAALKSRLLDADHVSMTLAPASVPARLVDPVAEALACALACYRHVAVCEPCQDYGRDVVGLAPVDVVRSAVLAFHRDNHRRDPRSVAADFFPIF